jgi:transcriptional antiterminator RfaH
MLSGLPTYYQGRFESSVRGSFMREKSVMLPPADNGRADDALRWYVVYTHPKQEDRVVKNLRAWELETFSPRIKERRCGQYGGPTYVLKHLFPRYVFARFRVGRLLSKVHYTRGVNQVVRFGDTPAQVDDEIIQLLQTHVDEEGFVRLGEELKRGDRVVIKNGLFESFVGVFEHELKDTDRVSILLSTVSFQSRLVIEKDLVAKID